jgi:crossover junction endodeoxyribonuclease RuvC
MNILGLDLSLTATGIAIVRTGDGDNHRYRTEVIKRPTKARDWPERQQVRWMIDEIQKVAYDVGAEWDLAVVEGLAYSRITGHATTRAGLWWLVTENLADDIPLAFMGPTSRAKYATGKGNAAKADVMREVARRFPAFYGGEDEADALVCAAAGADHLGHPIAAMPATHRAALAAVEWPATHPTPGAVVPAHPEETP